MILQAAIGMPGTMPHTTPVERVKLMAMGGSGF